MNQFGDISRCEEC